MYFSTGKVQYIEEDISSMGGEVLGYYQDPLIGGRGIMGVSIAVQSGQDLTQVHYKG